jgi:hypothetical protein
MRDVYVLHFLFDDEIYHLIFDDENEANKDLPLYKNRGMHFVDRDPGELDYNIISLTFEDDYDIIIIPNNKEFYNHELADYNNRLHLYSLSIQT